FIKASRPILLIHNKLKNIEYVLAQNQTITSCDTYTLSSLENLPRIYLESAEFNHEVNSEEFLTTINKMPFERYQSYTIVWRSKTEIILELNQAKLRIICDSNTVINNDLIKYAERVHEFKKKPIKT